MTAEKGRNLQELARDLAQRAQSAFDAGVYRNCNKFAREYEALLSEAHDVFPDSDALGRLPARIRGLGSGQIESESLSKPKMHEVLGTTQRLVAALELELPPSEVKEPIFAEIDLSFVSDPRIRTLSERDFDEMRRAFVAHC